LVKADEVVRRDSKVRHKRFKEVQVSIVRRKKNVMQAIMKLESEYIDQKMRN